MNKMNKKGKIIGLSLIAVMAVSLLTAAIPSVVANPGPDLEIRDITPIMVSPTEGKYMVQYTIDNIGDAGVPRGHYSTLYIDGVAVEHKRVNVDLAADDAAPLGPDELTDTFDTAITYTTPPRIETIKVCADNYRTVAEDDETNNCDEVDLELEPDLIIIDKDEEWTVNGYYQVTYTVQNNPTVGLRGGPVHFLGPGTAPASHYTRLWIDGFRAGERHVPVDLVPGATYTDTFASVQCTPPDDDIEVETDIYDNVDNEENELNNILGPNVLICRRPDLIIESKEEEWVGENRYRVSYVVKNRGSAKVNAGHTIGLWVDPVGPPPVLGVPPVPLPDATSVMPVVLEPGDTYQGTFVLEVECTLPEDDIWVGADIYGDIVESNENNNLLQNTLICKPDLVIESKEEEWVDGGYRVCYTIHNMGVRPAPATHHTTLYLNGVAIEHKRVPVVLDPCETYTVCFDTVIECTPQSDTIRVCADNYDVIDESNELNNCLENEWICGPDLVIDEKWEEQVDDGYIVHYVIHNQGNMTAPASHDTTLYVDGVEVAHDPVPVDLAPCETYEGTFDAIVCTPPSDIIRVCADNFDEVKETDETNNCLENEWECAPDLVIESKEEEWVDETNYQVTIEIHNAGTTPVPPCWYIELWVDGILVDRQHVDVVLNPCEILEKQFPIFIKCTGTSDVIEVYADADNTVVELDETNNYMMNVLECPDVPPLPDLVIQDISARERRGRCSVSFEIMNIGTAPTPRGVRHYATLYVNGVETEHKGLRRTLESGQSKTLTFRTRVKCTDTIRVCADDFDNIHELSEVNNCLDKP